MATDQASVSLLRWLRRQLRQPTPLREHLEAAVANDDPAEARRLLERFDFTESSTGTSRASSSGGESGPSEAAENAELVRRIFDAFARKQGFALRGLFAEDATWVVRATESWPARSRVATRSSASSHGCRRRPDGTYGSRLIDVLASDDRAAALYRAFGSRNGRALDIDQVLLFRIEDGLVRHVLALPCDPPAFEEFWAP